MNGVFYYSKFNKICLSIYIKSNKLLCATFTGKCGKVVGAKINKVTDTVVPQIKNPIVHYVRTRQPPLGSLQLLDEELIVRKGCLRKVKLVKKEINAYCNKLKLVGCNN